MKRKIFIAFISFCIIIIVAFLFFKKPYLFYSAKNFDDIEIEKMQLDGDDGIYSIKDGKIYKDQKELNGILELSKRKRILKLALFYQSMKENPILFDPNLDLPSFENAVSLMKQPNNEVIDRTGWGSTYPIGFLQNFYLSSYTYKNFANNVSEENARKFIDALENTDNEYAKEVERYENIFSNSEKVYSGTSFNYLAGDSSTNWNIVASDFKKMQLNSDELTKQLKERKECFNSLKCNYRFADIEEPKLVSSDDNDKPIILPQEDINIFSMPLDGGPFKIHSNCWKNRSEDYIYEAANCKLKQGVCLDWPFLADGEYYSHLGNSDAENKLKDQGVQMQYQSSSAPYECNDLTYKPELRTMTFLYKNFNDERLFDESFENSLPASLISFWQKGKIAESDFFDAEFPSDTSFENLADFYRYAYFVMAKNKLGDIPMRESFLRRLNIMKGKNQQLDLILNRSAFHFMSFMQRNRNEQNFIDRKEENVFLNRMDYSLTLMNFSGFIWRTSQNLQYIITQNEKQELPIPLENRPALTWNTAVKVFGEDNIKKWNALSGQAREVSF